MPADKYPKKANGVVKNIYRHSGADDRFVNATPDNPQANCDTTDADDRPLVKRHANAIPGVMT